MKEEDPDGYKIYKMKEQWRKEKWLKNNPEKAAARKKWVRDYDQSEAKRQKDRERQAKRRKENPEWMAKMQAQWWERTKADPKRHQSHLETQRMRRRLKALDEGRPLRRMPPRVTYDELQTKVSRVDAEPFRKWVKLAAHGMSYYEFAKSAGVDHSGLMRTLDGRYHTVSLEYVDNVLTTMSGPPLRSLYPDA
jgi:hypothetical protein